MAKQRDDHDQPRNKKEEPSDVLPLDDLEIVEEEPEIVDLGEDDIVEVEAAPPRPTPPIARPVTPPPPRQTPPPPPLARPVTPSATQQTPPPMPPGMPLHPPQAEAPTPPPVPHGLEPEPPTVDPKRAVLGKKRSVPTMLAPQEEGEELEPLEAASPPESRTPSESTKSEQPVDPKKTQLASRSSTPTMLATPEEQAQEQGPGAGVQNIPNLSLDEPKPGQAQDDVLDIVEAEPASEVRSDILASEFSKTAGDGPQSDVIDLIDAEPVSGAQERPSAATRPASDVVELTSDVVEAESASAVVEAESASGVIEAEALSDVVEAESASGVQPASDVIDFNDIQTASEARKQPGSATRSGSHAASDVVEMTSDVLEAESGSAVEAAASDVIDFEEVQSASEARKEEGESILAEEPKESSGAPSSAALADKAEEASDVVDIGEEPPTPSPRDLASDVFSAEELEIPSSIQKQAQAEDVLGEEPRPRPGEFASDIFSAETVEPEDIPGKPSAAASGSADEEVLEEIETAGTGSSAVNWDDVGAASDVRSGVSSKNLAAEDLDQTVAFDDVAPKQKALQTGDDLVTAEDLGEVLFDESKPLSGVDPVAEALESGVNLEKASGKKKKKKKVEEKTQALSADDVDFDSIEAVEDASAVNLGGPPSRKAGSVREEVETDAATELELASLDDIEAAEEAAEAADAMDADEASEVEEAVDADEALEAVEAAEEFEEAAEADEVIADDLLAALDEEEAQAAPRKKGKKSAEEEAEDLLLAEDATDMAEALDADEVLEAAEAADFEDVEDVRPAMKGKKSRAALLEDEEMLEDSGPPRRKKRKSYGEDDDEGGVAVLTRKPPKPKYGRRWLGGIFVGLLLAVGGAAAVWYFAPEVLDQIPQSPTDMRPKVDPVALKAESDTWRTRFEEQEAKTTKVETALKKSQAELAKAKEAAGAELKKVQAELAETEGKLKETAAVVAGVHKAMLDEAIISKDDAPEVKVLTAALVGLGSESREYKQINKLLKGADIKEPGSKGLMKLFDAKKAVDEELASIDKLLEGEKLKDAGSKGVAELVDRKNVLLKDRDSLNNLVLGAFKILVESRILNPKDDPRATLLAGVEEARRRGESPLATPLTSLATGLSGLPLGLDRIVSRGIDTVAMAVELEYFRKREPLITGPDRNIDLYLVLLQDRSRGTAKDLEAPVREANWLLSKEAKSPSDLRAKAHYVMGLARRNEGKLDEAVKSFGLALKEIEGKKDAGLWADLIRVSHAELTDPNAYYIPLAEKLATEGNFKKAIEQLDVGLKVMPENPRLQLTRGMVRLEQGRAAGKVPVEDIAAIREDATAALKAPATRPMGTFVLALLEEDQNNIGRAEAKLREALEELKKSTDADTRVQREMILAALSRVLQQDRFDEVAPLPKKEGEDKKTDEEKKADEKKADEKKELDKKGVEKKDVEKKDAEKKEDTTLLHDPRMEMLAMAMIGVFPPLEEGDEDPETKARLLESIKLAEELIASENPKIKGQGLILKGKAVSKLGDRNEGLRLYVRGVQLAYPGKAGEELIKLVEEHPAISYPDSAARPNRYTAEEHYGRGLHHYWFHNPVEAEKAFRQAIYWFREDARYHYFLGLSLYAQKGDAKEGKKKHADAIYAFQMGSRHEAKSMPSPDDVNLALERIQGPIRQMINEYRLSAVTAPVLDEPKKK